MTSNTDITEMTNGKKTVITTHVNADFDAMASMLAAQKLYPGAIVVFPGSYEKGLRNFFVQSMVYLFNMADIRDVPFEQIGRLVLVDTRRYDRIGLFSDLLSKYDVDVHIYDHHPPAPNDIRGDVEVIRITGATVTILTGLIEEKKINVSAEEATVMCLGIYEDTGSFTFVGTTESDFRAAAFLVSKGADLKVISDLISREITPEQVGLLNDIIQAAGHYNINGVDIVITTLITDDYKPDFAMLVHKMVKMENLKCIFALAQMGNKVYVVARSQTGDLDAGHIVSLMGGGGHPFAAAASIKGKTLNQVENELIQILYEHVRSSKQARDLMTSPAIKVMAGVTLKDADKLLNRFNVNALLVVRNQDDQEVLIGCVTRQIIEKALYHGLDDVPVEDYMMTNVEEVGPDAEITEIQEKIIENNQRILPVVEDGQIKGVITRTDLLNTLVRQSRQHIPDPHRQEIHARTRMVTRFMEERLSDRIINILKELGDIGSRLNCAVYVVGGFVRDLFLYRPNEDIDIVVEGDGILFAKTYASAREARVHSHAKFGTAVIIFPDGFHIDVASARMEYYRFPADLPTVQMSSIKLDLYRRDFTINTLAIRLDPERFGTLIDFFTAQKDIKEKTIRVLHNLSFVEDPTRVFRAIRFEQRFGFTIGKLTSGLIKNAVKMDFFKQLSGRRVFGELRQILEEDNPTPAILRLQDYDLLSIIHPSLNTGKKVMTSLNSVRKVLSWFDLLFLEESYMKWVVYLLILTRFFDRETSEEICTRLELPPKHRVIFCRERFAADEKLFWILRHLPVKNSVLYRQLHPFRTEVLLYMMSVSRNEDVKKSISYYLNKLRYTKISVTGKDLKKMGVQPGPIYKETLDATLDARLNGLLKTRNDELAFAKNYV